MFSVVVVAVVVIIGEISSSSSCRVESIFVCREEEKEENESDSIVFCVVRLSSMSLFRLSIRQNLHLLINEYDRERIQAVCERSQLSKIKSL